MAIVVVERSFEAPVEFEELQETENCFAWCLEENGIQFIQTYFSLDRKRMTCIYEAPDAEAVRRVSDRAKLPYDRIWSATIYKH